MWIKACHSNIWVWLFSSAVILLVGSLLAQQMMQNMFQEGLYHVFFKETPAACPPAEATDHEELDNVRIHRWFGTVVNTRLLVAGVRGDVLVLVQTTGQHVVDQLANMSACFLSCVSPSGGSSSQCFSLHTCHSHTCVCELQLLRLHDNTSVVEPVCESTQNSNPIQTETESKHWVITVCVVTVCGCWVSGNRGSEKS